MDGDREKILERIRKCLELSRCADGGEAAAALEAARRLMEKYQVTEEAVAMADVAEAHAPASTKTRPNNWESCLAHTVAEAFRCKVFSASYWYGKRDWIFIGLKESAAVASYAFAVLLRQVKAGRRRHVACLYRSGARLKTLRGDIFCEAWVEAVREKVAGFAAGEEYPAALDAYISKKYQVSKEKARNRIGSTVSRGDMESYVAGKIEGESVELRHGVAGKEEHRQGLLTMRSGEE